ncbi:MAG TPA: YdcF family protein [Clostridia bacterium]|nr:YdcF family protein [Clostridia bacterium]
MKLLYPTSLCLVLLLVSVAFAKRKVVSRIALWLGIAVLMVCGNGWLIGAMTRHLEWKNLPPQPVPKTDCILILSGGVMNRVAPRPTVEVDNAGDRVIYGAHLYRQGVAPYVVCTGNVATGGIAPRPASDDMAEMLEMLGVPDGAILKETKSENTHQHGRNLTPVFKDKGFKRVLLITSAMHMPRSLGVFRRACPEIEFIPAPTDFHATERLPKAWYRELTALVPTPRNLLEFSEVMHEYLGIAYYRMRGWM